MKLSPAIIDELENGLQAGTTDRRMEVLQRITDLFVHNARNFTEEQIALFDDVMGRLLRENEKIDRVAPRRPVLLVFQTPRRNSSHLSTSHTCCSFDKSSLS